MMRCNIFTRRCGHPIKQKSTFGGKEIVMSSTVRIGVNGKPIQQYSYKGQTFVEGRVGSEYAINVYNESSNEALAVVAVDGINVIDGKPSTSDDRKGYIIAPWQTIDIKGFRKDMDTIGAFKFCEPKKSYCKEAGMPGNQGIISVRLFEKARPVAIFRNYLASPVYTRSNDTLGFGEEPMTYPTRLVDTGTSGEWTQCAAPASRSVYTSSLGHTKCSSHSYDNSLNSLRSAPEPTPKFDVGTTWGKSINNKVREVEFEVGDLISEDTIYYTSRKVLIDMGIIQAKQMKMAGPVPYKNYAKPPKGWRG